MRWNRIEFRYSRENGAHELVRWEDDGESCYTIAFFRASPSGYYMGTVGERFFEDKDAWVVGKYALRFLGATTRLEKAGD